MTDRSILAAAEAMRLKRDELIAQPLGRIWRELAEAGISAFRAEEVAIRRANCKHPNRRGSGSIGSDGPSTWDWYCPECGAADKGSTPGSASPPQILVTG